MFSPFVQRFRTHLFTARPFLPGLYGNCTQPHIVHWLLSIGRAFPEREKPDQRLSDGIKCTRF